ncbi:hypothetical protein RPO70_11725, partial [Staphylococcus arlettae]|uniref:hypothetical protein n=1 Tax=Staphylococcus arlettae TaxID=29378 RepID=UPI0028A5537D
YQTITRNELDAANGAYAFAIPKWTDAKGVEHTFLPGQAFNPKVRVWYEPYTDPSTGSQVVPVRDGVSNPMFRSSTATSSNYLDLQYVNN